MMKARIWWRIRNWWHYPNMYVRCVKPATFWDEVVYYQIYWRKRDDGGINWGALRRLIVRHAKAAMVGGYLRLRWWSQLRCNGNRGGWRTHFCDWLEDQARDVEDSDVQ
jgi:hypothetical protein